MESESSGRLLDYCELIDRCDGVAVVWDPCDHIVGIAVGQVLDDAVLSVEFVLDHDPFGDP